MSHPGSSAVRVVSLRTVKLPYSVHEYQQKSHERRPYFDGLRFGAMRYAGGLLCVIDSRFKESRLTGVRAWHNRWAYWGGRGASDLRVSGSWTDGPFVRCFEVEGYEMRLSEMAETFGRGGEAVPYADLSLIFFARSYDQVCWYQNSDRCVKEFAFKYKWRT